MNAFKSFSLIFLISFISTKNICSEVSEIKNIPATIPADIKKQIFTYFIYSHIKNMQEMAESDDICNIVQAINIDLNDLKKIEKHTCKVKHRRLVNQNKSFSQQYLDEINKALKIKLEILYRPILDSLFEEVGIKGFDIINQGINATNDKGETPLHKFIAANGKEFVANLVKLGANVNSINKKLQTPLHLAAVFLHLEIARLLLENGAHVNAQDNRGCTPLAATVICCAGDAEMVKLLLSYQADFATIKDCEDETALDIATKKHQTHALELFESYTQNAKQ